jgi:hypothetical protein
VTFEATQKTQKPLGFTYEPIPTKAVEVPLEKFEAEVGENP